MNEKLKNIIFDKLYEDLSNVEIIPHYNKSILFIDRETQYWYLEYGKSGDLYFKHDFFVNFFSLFSIEYCDFTLILSEWVEEVLNKEVDRTVSVLVKNKLKVEEVLNYKINSTGTSPSIKVKDLLTSPPFEFSHDDHLKQMGRDIY